METEEKNEMSFCKNFIEEIITNLDKEKLSKNFTKDDVDRAFKSLSGKIEERLEEQIKTYNLPLDAKQLTLFAINSIYKIQYSMGETGIVIAGYGENDHFPCYVHYKCHGNILDKIAYVQEEGQKISHDNHSHVEAFAMKDMVDTFRIGLSHESYVDAGLLCYESLQNLATSLNATPSKELEELIRNEEESFRNKLLYRSYDKNYGPLTQIIASLPIDDMVELAETLVSLESLKEKVTQPSESIGGPVDVAVITKGEGLVWVKRKYYFKPEINPRYFQRENFRV
jgi:hypothetical protein